MHWGRADTRKWTHLFYKYLPRICYVPAIVLGAGYRKNKTKPSLSKKKKSYGLRLLYDLKYYMVHAITYPKVEGLLEYKVRLWNEF